MGKRASGRLPDFLIVGAAKCGTTTLYHYLSRHPEIFMSPVKEPCYFDPAVGLRRGEDWYRALFAGARPEQRCGEASTNYTRHPQVRGVPERIASVLPRARLVYLMRDPVARAYAHYVHRYTKEIHPGRPVLEPFEAFVEREPMCVDGSDYMLQIEQYLPHFPRESFLFLFLEDLARDPARVLRRLFRFLGVSPDVDVVGGARLVANDHEHFHEDRIRAEVTAPLRRHWLLRRLAYLGPQSLRDGAYQVLRRLPRGRRVDRAYAAPPLSEETRRALRERYGASDRALSERLGLEPAWR